MAKASPNGKGQFASSSKEKERRSTSLGNSKQPDEGDPNLQKWQLENSLVMSWLLNTMTNEIGENFLYYDTAKEMWDAVNETYSNVDNTSAIFEIKSLLHDLRQGEYLVMSILIPSADTGSNWTLMKPQSGSVQMT